MDLYKNIHDLRIAHGWTQEELARRMGYADKSAISRIERGQYDLPQSKIVEFARVLGVEPGDLMGWDDEQQEVGSDGQSEYYLSTETAKLAQEIYDDPELRLLFDAARDSRPEDLKMAADLLKRLKGRQ